jgi:hypothetical protein
MLLREFEITIIPEKNGGIMSKVIPRLVLGWFGHLAGPADSEKLNGVAANAMRRKFVGFASEIVLNWHMKITDTPTLFTYKMVMGSGKSIIMFLTIAKITTTDSSLFNENSQIAINIA